MKGFNKKVNLIHFALISLGWVFFTGFASFFFVMGGYSEDNKVTYYVLCTMLIANGSNSIQLATVIFFPTRRGTLIFPPNPNYAHRPPYKISELPLWRYLKNNIDFSYRI